MKYEVGQIITGTITTTKPYAIFMIFDDDALGLLHISEISDSFVKDIERYGTVGDLLTVKVLSIDAKNGFLRLSLKQVPVEERYSTHTNSRKVPQNDENDFKVLKDKMSEWIDTTLEKIKEESNK